MRGVTQFGWLLSATTFYGPASNSTSHSHVCSLMGLAFNEGILLSSQDPCPIAKLPSNPRSIPYCSFQLCSNHPPRLWYYANQTPELQVPPKPSNTLLSLSKLWMTSENPDHISVFIYLHHSILVLLNSKFVFMSSSQFSPFHFWYIKPFQYSCSLILASALPSYISASFLLNSSNSL